MSLGIVHLLNVGRDLLHHVFQLLRLLFDVSDSSKQLLDRQVASTSTTPHCDPSLPVLGPSHGFPHQVVGLVLSCESHDHQYLKETGECVCV